MRQLQKQTVLAVFLLAQSAALKAGAIPLNRWMEFSFYDVGVQARGCFPADPADSALDCFGSSANNSMFAGAPSWTFTSASAILLTLTDAFLYGDSFNLYDHGSLVGATPSVSNNGLGCGDNPAVCSADPLASHRTFLLSPGSHSIDIVASATADAGAAYFRADLARGVSAPEPATWILFTFALGLIVAARPKMIQQRSRAAASLLVIAIISGVGAMAQPRAPDASPDGGVAIVTGNYSVAGDTLRAVVYRPAVLGTAAPLVLVMHGNHGTCGRPYNPRPVGTDAPGLPCTRPAGGGPCTEGIRLDNANYTAGRACPAGTVEVNSYLGYEYAGRRLASQGYVVVSVDANLINARNNGGPAGDTQLIDARGVLALQHLQQLSDWTRNGGAPAGAQIPRGGLDLTHVALVGHSRGGEAMRSAYNQYRAAPSPWPGRIVTAVNFEAIFEIGPTDFKGYNASGVVWNVLLPMCDGDVSTLAGVKPFDRMMLDFGETPMAQKSTYTVWGANHNFYNTEWKVSDTARRRAAAGGGFEFAETFPCTGGAAGNNSIFSLGPGSPAQRLTALSSVPALIRGNLGGAVAPEATFNRNFNTLFALPANINNEANAAAAYPTRVDRGYSPTANTAVIRVMEDFDKAAGTNTSGQANDSAGITINHVNGLPPPAPPGAIPNHDRTQRVGYMDWAAAGAAVLFQANWTALNRPGVDVTGFQTLDFRVSRHASAGLNSAATADFSIRLVGANGVLTRPLRLSNYAPVANDLRGPVGGGTLADKNHPILQTYRIPLRDFGNFAAIGPQVRGVRFIFDQTASGAIFVGNIRFVRTFGSGVPAYPPAGLASVGPQDRAETAPAAPGFDPQAVVMGAAAATQQDLPCQIVRMQRLPSLSALDGSPGVEVEVASEVDFTPMNEVLAMFVGSNPFLRSYYSSSDTNGLIFALYDYEWSGLMSGDTVTIQYGSTNSSERWGCGVLDKSLLIQ